MRVPFDTVFTVNEDKTLVPKQRIRVGGVEFGPKTKLSKGVALGGIDFTQFINRELKVETKGDVIVIKGIY